MTLLDKAFSKGMVDVCDKHKFTVVENINHVSELKLNSLNLIRIFTTMAS